MNQVPNSLIGSHPLPCAPLAKDMPLHNPQLRAQAALLSAAASAPRPQSWLPPLVPQQVRTSFSSNPSNGSVLVPSPPRLQQVEAMLAHVIEQNRQLASQQQYIQNTHLQVVQKLQSSFEKVDLVASIRKFVSNMFTCTALPFNATVYSAT